MGWYFVFLFEIESFGGWCECGFFGYLNEMGVCMGIVNFKVFVVNI